MSRDTLYLIQPGFEDVRQPGPYFVCPHCNVLEGLLASFPKLAEQLDVVRVPFPRPRAAVIAAVGEEHQSLPLLVFGDDAPADASTSGDARFVNQSKRIAELLAQRHGFPLLHG